MALSQKGANYKQQPAVQKISREIGNAMDDLASQIQAVRTQGNFGQEGPPLAPHPLTSISVVAKGGFGTVQLVHANAPAGTQYIIEASTTPNFLEPMRFDNGISLSTLPLYLKGNTLYWRAAPKLPASAMGPWLYFGGTANPTAVAF